MFTNMNQAQKDITIRALICVGVFIVLVFGMIFTHFHVNSMYDNSQASRRIFEESQVKLTNKERKVQKNITDNSASSSDPILRDIGQNHNDMVGLKTPIYKFAKVYYNWSNPNQYNNRANNYTLKQILAPSILHNKAVFPKFSLKNYGLSLQQDVDLNSVLSNMSVSQVSKNGSGTTALVDMYYTTWTTSNGSDDGSSSDGSDTGNKNNGSQWFLITLNNKKNKITSIKSLYINPQAHLSSMDTSSSQAGSGVQY